MSRRVPYVAAIATALAFLGASSIKHAPILVWNVTASAPIGLYWIDRSSTIAVGELALVATPASVRKLAADRRYIPLGVLLIKRVAAGDGDLVCAQGVEIAINGKRAAIRLLNDSFGRSLPWWTGCRRLVKDERLLLTANVPNSFDGRYFGPVKVSTVVGRAYLLWPV